jgi:probable rRNA maturation factor
MVVRLHNLPIQLNDHKETLLRLTKWMCKELQLRVRSIDIIFADDDLLKEMHKTYLNNNSSTDVMTFNLSDDEHIEGEIYISLSRTEDQARLYKITVINEISRLVIHACLHWFGLDDKLPQEKSIMKRRENAYLKQVEDLFLI